MTQLSGLASLSDKLKKEANDISKYFASPQKTNKDRMSFLLKHVGANFFVGDRQTYKKSLHFSLTEKSLGNECFRKKHCSQACHHYTTAIQYFPTFNKDNCDELAIIIANRSAALHDLGDDQSCLQDISSALDVGYPKELYFKLFLRQGKSYQRMKEYKAALSSLVEAQKWLENASFKNWQDKTTQTKVIQEFIVKAELQLSTESGENDTATGKDDLPARKERIHIACNEQFGHHVIATEDIVPGELVMECKAVCSIVDNNYYQNHCFQCLRKLLPSRVYCRQCTDVAYCNYQCEADAWRRHHKIECGYLYYFTDEWGGAMAHLSFRVANVFQEEIVKHAKVDNQTFCDSACAGVTWSSFSSLLSNEQNRDCVANFELSVLALHICRVCFLAFWFDETETKPQPVHRSPAQLLDNNFLVTLFTLVLGIVQRTQCNAIAVSEVRVGESIGCTNLVHVGLALYSNVSRLNHSCDPDVEMTFNGDVVRVFAVKNIHKSTQIFNDYGVIFLTQKKQARQEYLKTRYFFNCTCSACAYDWPVWEGLENKQPQIVCPYCQTEFDKRVILKNTVMQCKRCGKDTNIVELLKKLEHSHDRFREIMDATTHGHITDITAALPVLEEHLSMLQTSVGSPWQEFYTCQSALKQILRIRGHGNTSIEDV